MHIYLARSIHIDFRRDLQIKSTMHEEKRTGMGSIGYDGHAHPWITHDTQSIRPF
jgi:hypothetical protein